MTVWVEAVRDIGPRDTMSHGCGGENEITYVVLFVGNLYLFQHEMLCVLSLCVKVKTGLAILCGISKGSARAK